MNSELLDKSYEPHDVERRWYSFWEEKQMFAASEESAQKCYSIVIPPPNITGDLHMGHALNITIQDILCRYRRARGDNVLWMPGTDHAGIATQNVVEKKLAGEGLDRHQLGREKFIETVWQWRNRYGSAITNQLKRLGASCDWKRERFTMDEGLSRAVCKVFVQLYNEGLIYRGDYIINWCPRCRTALADIEVEHKEHDGHLYYIRYPFAGGSGGVVIATTRPETMIGDTAMAVNPDDKRYSMIGHDRVTLPLTGRTIPIIRDRYVDMSFGTGALKITPAHDPNDFEIGNRHGLLIKKVIGDDGLMTSEAGEFEGLSRERCRKVVVEALEKEGLLEKVEPYSHRVGHCYRCKTVVEPNLSKQWFVSVKPLAKKAIAAVESGETRIVPDVWAKDYFNWMNSINDWCISRQIWWGHQIPAWTCSRCDELTVSVDTPKKCSSCGEDDPVQVADVLDTWFSSALWPFSTMGWPDESPLLKTFYPTSVLVTGFDILFFWVVRMMMMGIHFMKKAPFKDVYVHALIRDAEGKKMSKSKGNVIDPLTVIEKYGTDAFRFTLAVFAVQGRDIRMSEKRIEGYRHFVNKLWNATRFTLMHVTEKDLMIESESFRSFNLSLSDRWILSRLNHVTKTVSESLDNYRFNDAASALYKFVWHEFCDWHLEAIKPSLYGKEGEESRRSTMGVLWYVLRDTLILLHPFMPFVTEEIWHRLPKTEGSIMKAPFPMNDSAAAPVVYDAEAELKMELVIGIVTGIRNIKGEMNISPSLSLDVSVQPHDKRVREAIEECKDIIINLAKLKSFSIEQPGEKPVGVETTIVDGATIFVSLKEIIDFTKESQRLGKKIGKLADELAVVSKKLENKDFLMKAPAEIVEKVKEKHRILAERQQKLHQYRLYE